MLKDGYCDTVAVKGQQNNIIVGVKIESNKNNLNMVKQLSECKSVT